MTAQLDFDFPVYTRDSRGKYLRLLCEDDLIRAALAVAERRFASGAPLESPRAVADFLRLRFAGLDHEVFAVIFLDNRHRVLAFEGLFRGTIDGCSVHPREVVKRALETGSAAVVLAHNHPSGVAEPSRADEQLTRRLKEALALVDVRMLDHLVVGQGEPVSFAERVLL